MMKAITSLTAVLLLGAAGVAFAQGTAFTYQGRLNEGANVSSGNYDLTFSLWSAPSGPSQIGGTITNAVTAISNGLFTVTLDFGNQFPGAGRWLEIGVRTNGSGAFAMLSPRQALTSTPYAVNAANAGTAAVAATAGSVAAANITGTIPLAQLPTTVVTNGASGVNISGTFSGNGAGVTNVDVGNLSQLFGTVAAWGYDGQGQTDLPGGLGNVVAIAGAADHSLALRSDGTVVGWGDNGYGASTIPAGLSSVVAIAGGYEHSLALRSDGTVAVWGDNTYGQLNIPAGLSNVVAIAAGAVHSLALRSGGTVAAWGNNGNGQTNVPAGLSNVVAIAGGAGHSLALRSDGTVAAWGDNTYGQTNISAGLSNVVAIAGGDYHSLALRSDRTVAAWGRNTYGQTNIPAGLSNVVAIAAGWYHSLALRSDGTVVAWGFNNTGQLNIPAGLTNVVAIAAGGGHNLALWRHVIPAQVALLTGNNVLQGSVTAASFSGNGDGLTSLNASQLSSGTVPDARLSVNVPLLNGTNSFSGTNRFANAVIAINTANQFAGSFAGNGGGLSNLSSAQITGTLTTAQLPSSVVTNGASGVNISGTFSGNGAGVTNVDVRTLSKILGTVAAWGSNGNGQLNIPAGVSDVVAIAGGSYHSLAVWSDGTVAAWGENSSGQTNIPAGLSNVVATAAGESHSLALRSNGTLAAWGANSDGQLSGAGGLTNRVAIAAGFIHSLALGSDGIISAWGDNSYGQAPHPVGLTNVVAIAAAGYHSLALRGDGIVACWGDNNYGQSISPKFGNVVAIAAGGYHSLALRSDGTVAAWGDNSSGQTNIPAGLSNVVAIAAGIYHSLAMRSNGTVVAWGANTYGQTTIPAGLSNVVAIAAGGYHSLALWWQAVPAQVALLTTNNVFQGSVTAASFSGNGSGLTSLAAASVTGVLGTGQIPNLDASKITSGILADARLSSNVALRSSANTFNGNQTVTNGNVGIGNPTPGNPTPAFPLSLSTNLGDKISLWGGLGNHYGFGIQANRLQVHVDSGSSDIVFGHGQSTNLTELMRIRGDGNVGIGIAIPTNKLHVAGGVSATAFVSTSDRNAKENFERVSPLDVLNKVAALPIATWNFKDLNDGRHMGPMAQDFYAAFGLGGGNTTITSMDPDGVALAAIQGLNQKLEDRMQKLEAENAGLTKQLEEIKAALHKLTARD